MRPTASILTYQKGQRPSHFADALRLNISLMWADLRLNYLDAEGKAAIKEAVRSKEGFELFI